MNVLACVVCLNDALKRENNASGPKFTFSAVADLEVAMVRYDSRNKKWLIPGAFTVSDGKALCVSHLYAAQYVITNPKILPA